jgi:FkbM family methyltransferase
MQNRLIFDLGMHKGEDSEFYLRKGFSVIAVEADPRLALNASRRLDHYVKSGQLKILNKAISHEVGPVPFYACETHSIWGTIDKKWADRNVRLGARVQEITVEGIEFFTLLKKYGSPYYLKIDVEGADLFCLQSLLKQSERPKFISLESSKTSFDEVEAEFSLFVQLGYTKFKIIPQHRIAEQKLPNPPLEGIYLEHEFRTGCSGAFGLELPGEWLSREQALKQYRKIHRLYRLTGDGGLLTSPRFVQYSLNKGRTRPKSAIGVLVRKVIKPVFGHLGLDTGGWYDTHAMFTG